MRLSVTYYLDVISSWCFWAEPAWAELKKRYHGQVEFQWKIALLDKTGLPLSRAQEAWFYRRSGMLMRSPVMLSTAWYDEPVRSEYLAPNCVAVAAKDYGIIDDRVRLALAEMLLTTSPRLAICGPVVAVIAAAARPSVSAFCESRTLRICDERNNGVTVHSRFAG